VENNALDEIMGNLDTSIGLDKVLSAIKKAEKNDKIKGIYLESGALSGTPAMYEEIREALANFKKSGKFIIAYGDMYTQGGYYISSVADQVLLNPQGMINWVGMASQPIFFKETLDKLGVKMQVFRVGTYKSYVETYTSTKMSDANREQISAFVGSIWNNMLTSIAASRKTTVNALNAYADEGIMFQSAESFIKAKMVDKLAYWDEVKSILKKKVNIKDDDDLNLLTLSDMDGVEANEPKDKSGNEIAVYYAYGSVQDGTGSAYSEHAICSEDVCKDMEDLQKNDDVKAVVIRLNTGGGSAYASEQIWRAVRQLKAKKPVIISMGGMTASGGYYIASAGDYILAEPTTLTGSIGIFGMFPDASGLLQDKLGIHFDVVKTNRFADMGTLARPLNPAEQTLIQGYIDRGYQTFLSRVATGRKMKTDAVDKIAQGRVWVGTQAKTIGLVDAMGGLDVAIAEAAKRAKISSYSTVSYPAPKEWYEDLLNDKKTGYFDSQMREMLGQYYSAFMLVRDINKESCIQARMPFDPNLTR
jgi:protease-4